MAFLRSISFLLFTSLVFFSCTKKNDTNNKYPYYFKATINGQFVNYQANNISTEYGSGTNSMSSGLGPSDTDEGYIDHYEGTILVKDINIYQNAIEVYILKHFNSYFSPSEDEKNAMFYQGNYPYGQLDELDGMNTKNGAVIIYYDNDGVQWTSENGSQTGSTFAITELVENNDGTSKKIMKAVFTCKLYNQAGQSIQLTNGEIRGLVIQ